MLPCFRMEHYLTLSYRLGLSFSEALSFLIYEYIFLLFFSLPEKFHILAFRIPVGMNNETVCRLLVVYRNILFVT